MSEFDDLISDSDALIFEHSGDVGSYQSQGTGDAVACTVIIDENGSRDEVRNGDKIRIRSATIAVRRSDVDDIVGGDTITVGTVTWVVLNRQSRDASVTALNCEEFQGLDTAADGYLDQG